LKQFDHERFGDTSAISVRKMAVVSLIIGATLLLGISVDIWRVHHLPVSVDDPRVKPDANGKIRSLSPEPRTPRRSAKTQGATQPTGSIEKETSQDLSVVRLKSKDLDGSAQPRMASGPTAERPSKTVAASAHAKVARSEPKGSRPSSVSPVPAGSPARKHTPEVLVLPVIHDHFFGSCRGTLTVSRKSVIFEPSSSSGHRFEASPTEVSLTNLGDRLEISFNNKSYRFKVNPKIDKAENRSKLEAISLHLTKIKAGNDPN
jgi:hypothetical protein